LDNVPVVISLRDIKIFGPVVSGGDNKSYLRCVYDIRVGTKLVLHDTGSWNVNTTALHFATVSLDKDSIGGTDRSDSDTMNPTLKEYVEECSAVLPPRRKHRAMSTL
jgi:hypothetical protein